MERKPPRLCAVEECDRAALARGWCSSHYTRWQKNGDVRADEPLVERDGYRKCHRCQRVKASTNYAPSSAWCKRCVTVWEDNRRDGRKCSDCSAPITVGSTSGRCHRCVSNAKRAKVPKRYLNASGYVTLTAHWDHPNANSRGRILEHKKVMAEMLGRPLRPGENVHHINGVKDDNRPENLELWVTSQPSGQRPVDLVAWAHEILERYGDEVTS